MHLEELNFKIKLNCGEGVCEDKANRECMFVFWGIIIPIISAVGLFGNILTIVVLFRREMQSITVYFLRALVVTDTAIIIGGVLGISVISITQRDSDLWLFTDVIYPHIYTPIYYIVMASQMMNVWVTVAVSVERYVAICHPFRYVEICTKRNAYTSLGVIVAISLLFNIPRCFATTAAACVNESSHDCFQQITTEFGDTYFYSQIYFFWMYLILIFTIPLVTLLVLNTRLIAELMRMLRRRPTSNPQENAEANMSLVLVLILIVFIVCQTPGLCAQFTFWNPNVLVQWTCVSNTLFILNSSVNFLIYIVVGRKFRKVFLKTFQVIIKKLKLTTVSQYSQNGTEVCSLNIKPSDLTSEDTDENSHLNPSR